jgi:hypothetical protein
MEDFIAIWSNLRSFGINCGHLVYFLVIGYIFPVAPRKLVGKGLEALACTRVARWFVFKPKIPIWKILECLRMENAGIFYGHLEYFTVI